MTSTNNTVIAAHPLGATLGIVPVLPQIEPQAHRCEIALNVGVFFDGTGNNQHWSEPGHGQTQLQRQKDSNVARLFRAYPDAPLDGYFRVYIPGVGTPFPDIGEDKPATLGEAFGKGGDGRINFGLLQIINAIYRSISPNQRPYTPDDTIKALCRNGKRYQKMGRDGRPEFTPLVSHDDEPALRRVNMETSGGLLLNWNATAPQRQRYLKRACRDTHTKMSEVGKPKITEIFIDIYGFSRGAAEARVFTNWLVELFEGGKLCGVPTKIRFLGLFDTVASVGLPASMGLGQNGHCSWAQPEWMRIPEQVQNCVHFVAMHENRGSFPVELIQHDGKLPTNCHEFMFPGMHSDVGGGYAPHDQGRGPHGKDEEKLSQIPLNAMYEASLQARVPLDSGRAADGKFDPFAISDESLGAFSAFMKLKAHQQSRQIREWMFDYLAWRYQVRHKYLSLPWHSRANASDREDLTGANRLLLRDAEALHLHLNPISFSPYSIDDPKSIEQQNADARVGKMRTEAADIYTNVLSAKPVDPAAATLFADYCHDSYAGFRPFDKVKIFGRDPIPGSWEPEGYFRWRRRYEGDNVQLVRNDVPATAPGETPPTNMASARHKGADLEAPASA